MAKLAEVLMNMLKLTDEVQRLNRDIERVETSITGINERVIRLESRLDTYAEVARLNQLNKQ